MTSAAKAGAQTEPAIAAVNRCATQNQPAIAAVNHSTPSRQKRASWGPRRCATQNQVQHQFFRSLRTAMGTADQTVHSEARR